tara:strand:+ start:2864 stop:3460 length:597 start_codon:yes stop_codon:yes gene_type:complete
MSSYDSYGEDIAGQAYSSYADTPGDAGGNDNFVPPTTIRTTDPTDLIDVAPPPSQRLNLIDRLGGGIRSIKDYFGDPDNQAGIFSGSVGAALFGPLAGIIAGLAGRRFASRNNNLLTGINTIDYDNTSPVTSPFILPEPKPFFIDQDIGPKYAELMLSYEPEKRKQKRNEALEEFYRQNPDMRPPEKKSGINQLEFTV